MLCLLLLAAALPAAEPVALKVAAVQFRSSFDLKDNTARIVAALEKLAAQGVRVAADGLPYRPDDGSGAGRH
jgi:hypothetical protein